MYKLVSLDCSIELLYMCMQNRLKVYNSVGLCQFRHLLSLKHYDGEIEELDLNFTLTVDDFGRNKVVLIVIVINNIILILEM